MKRVFLFIVSISLTLASLSGDEPKKEIKLLMIGNSFSANVIKFLPDIAAAGGKRIQVEVALIGGGTLDDHWKSVEAFEMDPTSKEGLRYKGKSLRGLLESAKWDLVSMQQGSSHNWDKDSYQPYAGKIAEYARKYAPQAELIWHVTWSRHESALNKIKTPFKTYIENHKAIQEASSAIARELGGLRMVQAGLAVQRAYQTPGSPFQMSVEPGDSNESGTLQKDGSHLNDQGSYLTGCLWYEFLFKESVIGNSFAPEGISPERIRFMQQTSHDAASEREKNK